MLLIIEDHDVPTTENQSPDFLRILGSEILGKMEGKVGSF
jgi:hypothetical protein